MGRKNIMTVLKRLLKEAHMQCEWQLNWLEESRVLTLHLQIPLINHTSLPLENSEGKVNQENDIIFETQLLFYDEQLYKMTSDEFLNTIPILSKLGIEYGELLVIVKYLKQLTSKAPLYFKEFLEDDSATTFKLQWRGNEFDLLKSRYQDQHRYSQERLFLPM